MDGTEPTSLWRATATGAPARPVPRGDNRVDVAIVGGGYTGLNAARALVARGCSVAVLEANRIGWGASGRNGGVVEGKFRVGFRDVARRHGMDAARRMYDFGAQAVDHVEHLVAHYGIEDAGYRAAGNMRCAHSPEMLDALIEEDRWIRDHLGARKTRILDAAEMERETGSRGFCGGILQEHGGTIHPLEFVRGLARGVEADGATLYEGAPVYGMKRERDVTRLVLEDCTVAAGQVLIATNAYSDLTGVSDRARRSVIPFRSAIVATEPLDTHRLLPGLVDGRSYSETRRMMRWFRLAGDRLLFGGRGAFGRNDRPSSYRELEAAMYRQFPSLTGVRIAYRWSGLVALTLQAVPQLVRQDDRTVHAHGFNGLGVATSSFLGKHAADLILGDRLQLGPLTPESMRTTPFHRLRSPAVRAVAGWYGLLDRIGR